MWVFLKKLWTPFPLPQECTYVRIGVDGVVSLKPAYRHAQIYALLDPACYDVCYFAWESLSWNRRVWCCFWGWVSQIGSYFSEQRTVSWWIHGARRWQTGSLYHQSLRFSKSWLRQIALKFKQSPFFMGFYAFERVFIEALTSYMSWSPQEYGLIIWMHASGLYEEWLVHHGAILRQKRFLLSDQAQRSLQHAETRILFVREKLAQILEEHYASHRISPQRAVVLLPFDANMPAQDIQKCRMLFLQEESALQEILSRTTPCPSSALGCGVLARWHTMRSPLRRITLCIASLIIIGSFWGACELRQIRAGKEQATQAYDAKKKTLLVKNQDFWMQSGLWYEDWDQTARSVMMVCKASEYAQRTAYQHQRLMQILYKIGFWAHDALSASSPIDVRLGMKRDGMHITSQSFSSEHDALVRALQTQEGTVLRVTRSPVRGASVLSEGVNLLESLPEPLECIEILVSWDRNK